MWEDSAEDPALDRGHGDKLEGLLTYAFTLDLSPIFTYLDIDNYWKSAFDRKLKIGTLHKDIPDI